MTSLHVLFVDDEQAILDGLRNSLRKERKRWEMTFALGGQQALEAMKQTPADVVITDMRMPGMDGAELLRHIQRDFPAARLLLSTTGIVAERESMDCRQSLGVAGAPLPSETVERSGKVSRMLVPFLRDEGRQFPDTYAFDLESPGPEYAVVVWCYADPGVVHEWVGFAAFFHWLLEYVKSDEKHNA